MGFKQKEREGEEKPATKKRRISHESHGVENGENDYHKWTDRSRRRNSTRKKREKRAPRGHSASFKAPISGPTSMECKEKRGGYPRKRREGGPDDCVWKKGRPSHTDEDSITLRIREREKGESGEKKTGFRKGGVNKRNPRKVETEGEGLGGAEGDQPQKNGGRAC